MNGDIRVRTTFSRHPKTRKLRRRLGADGVLSLLELWIFTAESRSDGVLHGLDEEDIGEVSGWRGEAQDFVKSLADIGFLDHDGDGYVIHDWAENNPWAAGAERRSQQARDAAKARWSKGDAVGGGHPPDADGMQGECSEHADSNAPLLSSPSHATNTSKPAVPPCPHQEIIDLYHEILPELRGVIASRWSGTRQKNLQARWREDKQHQTMKFWNWFFRAVRANPHWMGRGDRKWQADLGWLLKPENFTKVVEHGTDQQRRRS